MKCIGLLNKILLVNICSLLDVCLKEKSQEGQGQGGKDYDFFAFEVNTFVIQRVSILNYFTLILAESVEAVCLDSLFSDTFRSLYSCVVRKFKVRVRQRPCITSDGS